MRLWDITDRTAPRALTGLSNSDYGTSAAAFSLGGDVLAGAGDVGSGGRNGVRHGVWITAPGASPYYGVRPDACDR